MKPWREHVLHADPLREQEVVIENRSIELSDEEYLRRANYVRGMMTPSEFNPMMPEALEMADKLTRKSDEKSKSKAPKSKPKKDNPKRHIPAVESIQEEL